MLSVQPEDPIAFEVVAENIHGSIWGSTVNGVEVLIIPDNDGWVSNLLDCPPLDFHLVVKKSLIAAAKLNQA